MGPFGSVCFFDTVWCYWDLNGQVKNDDPGASGFLPLPLGTSLRCTVDVERLSILLLRGL
jgi:hypothetical protein